MARCLLSLVLLFISAAVFSQQQRINLKKDFGAVGDGKTDDTKAFLLAAKKINQLRKHVLLIVPAGKYLVHPQKRSVDENAAPYLPVDVLSLAGCNDIEIRGEKGTSILYAGGLFYGSFRNENGRIIKLAEITTNYAYRVAVGYGIYLENCTNILMRNLELDGNDVALQLGGPFGDTGFQIDNDGVFIRNSSGVTLQDLNVRHFGRDGLLIINNTPQGMQTPSQNLVLENCKFEYNGRQGFSWVGGVGLIARSCSFSYTGKGRVYSSPGAGVDLEPDAGRVVANGRFDQCRIVNNSGVGMLADEGKTNVNNIQINGCILLSEKSSALWIKSPRFTVSNCSIFGIFNHGFNSDSPEEATKFRNCHFSDQYSGQAAGNYLIESSGARYISFVDCSFSVRSLGLVFIANSRREKERTQMLNCTFVNALYKGAKGVQNVAFVSGIDFSGDTKFIDSSNEILGWNIENTRFLGNTTPSTAEIGTTFNLGSYDTIEVGGTKGTTIRVEKGSSFSSHERGMMIVEPKSEIEVSEGGRVNIGPYARFILKGKLTANRGAFLCIHPNAEVSEESLKRIALRGKVLLPPGATCRPLDQ